MKGSTFITVAGAMALTVGIGALIFPLITGLTVAVLVAWGFLISGAFSMWGAFSGRDMAQRGWVFFFGLVELVLGVWMLANPFQGLVSLTLLAGVLLVLSGLGRLLIARRFGGWTFWLLVLAGLVSVGIGVAALFSPMAITPILIGTLLAIELIPIGVTLLALGIVLKRNTDV